MVVTYYGKENGVQNSPRLLELVTSSGHKLSYTGIASQQQQQQ